MGKWHYFTDEETKDLDQEFVATLERARAISNVPYIITSGFRLGDADGIDNGIKNSAHMNHLAVDLRAHDSPTRYAILKGLFAVGFSRIGINDVHIHVDMDSSKPQQVFWLEPNQTLS